MIDGTVIGCGVSLAEVVRLNLGGVTSKPLPVNLIKVIRLHDETADNASAVCCLHDNSDLSEENVEVTGDSWGLSLRFHREESSIRAIISKSGASGFGEVVTCTLGEINGDSLAESFVR